ncbi:hypothetical protein U9K52_08475 [Chryseobacterium sp. MHB01]|uniref:hypothetical protein n=1 Tax=Chryseobacterium sp. MHB01 TaxID=3109433 RepID=UPI002AFEAC44|nr:hypothetical protein [Chryseobacterium sp. MHB01]MEA1848943.1 hypothetical protein [Chryseobacterium sp. MHB01]
MKKLLLLIFFFSSFCYSQNFFNYSSFKTDDPRKIYKINVFYDNSQNLNYLIIDVESLDIIFNKSKFYIKGDQIESFSKYLKFLLNKKIEWDAISLKNKILDCDKIIEYEDQFKINCIYEDGPSKSDTLLHTRYFIKNGKSFISIGTPFYNDVKPSILIFSDNKLFTQFINRIDIEKIKISIKNDYHKKSLLK